MNTILSEPRRLANVALCPEVLGRLLGAYLQGRVVVDGMHAHAMGLPVDVVFGPAHYDPHRDAWLVICGSRFFDPVALGDVLPVVDIHVSLTAGERCPLCERRPDADEDV